MVLKLRVIFALVIGILPAGCRDIFAVCAGVGIDGIVVEVEDASGQSVLPGAMIIARDGSYADTAGPVVPYEGSRAASQQNVALADNRGGDYTVTVTKPFWSVATQRVRVPGGRCGYVETQHVRMRISMLPDAPPVRSVAVAPRSVLFGFCGSAVETAVFVDADSGESTQVMWRSENPEVATVTPGGLVEVVSRGTTHVLALSVADTAVTGRMSVRVDPVCP